MELFELSIYEARKKLDSGEISSQELTESVFERIESVEPKIDAYLTLCREQAFISAKEADKKISSGEKGGLLGIPVSVKDLICTKGLKTTCASKILENFIPPYDASVVTALKKEGAVITGKVNMDEFAMGSSTENSAFKKTKNPWDLSRIPGGSSGGSAACVSADMCLASLGSDTGGSIRQPASHCGVTGLKPSYGRVSRYGLVAFASSLDQIGPLTKTVEDSAIVMNSIAFYDPKDSTSYPSETPDYTSFLVKGMKGVKIGIIREYMETQGISPEVAALIKNSIEIYKGLGAEIVDVSLPHTSYAVPVYYVIAPSEASSNLARYDGVRYGFRARSQDLIEMYKETRSQGFGDEVKRRIIIGTYALSSGYYDAYYGKAQKVRTLILQDFKDVFDKVDILLSPVSPEPPFKIGENSENPLAMYLSDIFTISANLAGIPAISFPCGLTKDNLPVGLQLMSPFFEEGRILKAGYNFQMETNFHNKKPMV
ncbi:MAG: Asp-tRNA(Asn)/Glu-tRNA(Gln) amidotransferase GatCAB subunit A [Deltaproteobacteria bacterium]|nr:MAG: Asp-tRNA(Asn)/Glu-tRNA(Gln) amidotransferase GatCAB subunit A [Deltaproteobacteria bacterium]